MKLFKSEKEKEKELIENISKNLEKQGLTISKATFTGIKSGIKSNICLFVVDTNNKKWTLISNVYKNDLTNIKIYDFKDLKDYQISTGQSNSGFVDTINIGGLLSTTTVVLKEIKVMAFLNTNDIDDSMIVLLDQKIDTDNIMIMKKYEERCNDLIKSLEYIKNNK